mmetsp:Transcript_33386/g.92194  ORF Transcript_33386/g.92194 Transcript_33386/m.92194 type:complete len:304 (+) Transcript_33386:526-1437(+)
MFTAAPATAAAGTAPLAMGLVAETLLDDGKVRIARVGIGDGGVGTGGTRTAPTVCTPATGGVRCDGDAALDWAPSVGGPTTATVMRMGEALEDGRREASKEAVQGTGDRTIAPRLVRTTTPEPETRCSTPEPETGWAALKTGMCGVGGVIVAGKPEGRIDHADFDGDKGSEAARWTTGGCPGAKPTPTGGDGTLQGTATSAADDVLATNGCRCSTPRTDPVNGTLCSTSWSARRGIGAAANGPRVVKGCAFLMIFSDGGCGPRALRSGGGGIDAKRSALTTLAPSALILSIQFNGGSFSRSSP